MTQDSRSISHAPALEAISRKGFLGRLPPEAALDLVRSGPVVQYPTGSLSAHPADTDWAAIVVSGVVREYLPAPDGRQITLRYAEAGDLVGAGSAGPAPEIEAVEPAVLLHLDSTRLALAARVDPVLAKAFVDEMVNRLRHAYRILAGTTFSTVRSRIARDLIERPHTGSAGAGIRVRVTQQALADATGSVREVVARELRELRRLNVVDTDQLGVIILDVEALIEEAGLTA